MLIFETHSRFVFISVTVQGMQSSLAFKTPSEYYRKQLVYLLTCVTIENPHIYFIQKYNKVRFSWCNIHFKQAISIIIK